MDTTRRLRIEGWKVIRVWEHEDPEKAAEKIYRSIMERKK